jgi:hypothetical protein
MSLTSYRAAPPRVGRSVGRSVGVRPGGPAAADSPAPGGAVPWALGRFTAEFGMGSGVAAPRRPPGHPAGPRTTDGQTDGGAARGRPRPRARWEEDPAGRRPGAAAAARLRRLRWCGVAAAVVAVPRLVGVGSAAPRAGRGGDGTGLGRSVGRLGPLGCVGRPTCTRGLSTWWSATALKGRSRLEGGFALRCLQRLSRPHLATRRCRWRDNRSTRGASVPVLSY